MTTLAQYRTAIAGKIGLDNTSGGDQPNIDLWVNEGVTNVLLRTDCRVRCATLTMTAGTWKYTLDTSILKVKTAYVTSSSNSYPLEMVNPDELIDMQITSSASVSPAQYYAVDGSDFFMIYPTPASADTVNLFYVPRPATLSVSSDAPSEIPSEFHKAVEYYALAQAGEFANFAASQNGQLDTQRYEMWIRRVKKWVNMKGNHRLPLAQQRSRLQRLPFHDRSRYPY